MYKKNKKLKIKVLSLFWNDLLLRLLTRYISCYSILQIINGSKSSIVG